MLLLVFNQLRCVWKSTETIFLVFGIASQTINNSWKNSKRKFTFYVKFHDN